MRSLILSAFLLFSTQVFAQNYKAVSLYTSQALVTGRFLPFKVYNGSNQTQPIASAFVYGPCDTMIDINRPEIFHVYCTKSAEIDLIVRLKNGVLLSAKDIPIKKVSLIEPEIIVGGDLSLGARLFRDNCVECHRTQHIDKGQDAASVKAALAKDPMKQRGLDALFGADDEKIDALVKYINEEL